MDFFITMASSRMSVRVVSICAFLVAIVWAVFGQTLGHDFVNYDDKTYVYGNPVVTSGLTLRGIKWAFTHSHALNWHPLTTITHMLDCQLFGLKAGGHHFTNVLLHTIAVLLLFLVLRNMTSSANAVAGIGDAGRDQRSRLQHSDTTWRSAFVAAVFAIHPLRVESVAWIAERKDVLSAVFFMLTLSAYLRYTRKRTLGWYVTMSILFACGLMSKPMLVTVPFVLLLLDYWPLERIGGTASVPSGRDGARPSIAPLIVEKIPLFVLSAASCVATVIAHTGATGGSEPLPLMWRINNALVSYATYIWQIVWPSNLAVAYPTNPLPIWQAIVAIAFLIVVTAIAIRSRRTRPYLFTGWFWYLGMLVPVIGLFQIGWQSHADRYTYLSQIGLYLLVTWTVADILKTPNAERRTSNTEFSKINSALGVRRSVFGVCFIIISALTWRAWDQTKHWKNSETLWTHTLAVTSNNDIAHHNFALYLVGRGRIDEAISHYEAALKIRSGAEEARYNLTSSLVHNNLGAALVRKGRTDDAIAHYRKAIELRPDYADAHFNLGAVLLENGQLDEAIAEWQTTLSIHPDDVDAHATLADALVQKHRISDALSHYQAAVQLCKLRASEAQVTNLRDTCISTLNKLAWIWSTCPDASLRDGPSALEVIAKANEYSGGTNPILLRTLAAAYAEGGRFDDAIETAARASQIAEGANQNALANALEKDVDLYRGHVPVRDFNLTNAHPDQ